MILNKVIPPVSPDRWRFQLVVVPSLHKSVYLDRERFMEFIDRIPELKAQELRMFERLDRDKEFDFSYAIPIPEDVVRDFPELESHKSGHNFLNLE